MERVIIPRKIDVVVVSSGGVGTTFLLSFISKYKNTFEISEADFKHIPIPPISFNSNVKIVYIYGNPILAAVSLFRRGYHYGHTINYSNILTQRNEPIPLKQTLDEYAENSVDKFQFRDHFMNWYSRYKCSHSVMFVRYESIFDNVEKLFEFIDVPQSCVKEFPKKSIRSSSFNDLSNVTLEKLKLMYGDFNLELDNLDDVIIKKRQRGLFRVTRFISLIYFPIIIRQFYKEFPLYLKNKIFFFRKKKSKNK